MTVPFTIIYHDGNKYRHKQVRGSHAWLVGKDFQASNPQFEVKEVFCGKIAKMFDEDFQKICSEVYENED